MKKLTVLFLIMCMTIAIIGFTNTAIASTQETMVVTIGPFSDNLAHDQTIKINGLENIIRVTSDNGNAVVKSVNGESVTITVSNGAQKGPALQTKDIQYTAPIPETIKNIQIDKWVHGATGPANWTPTVKTVYYPRNENWYVWTDNPSKPGTYIWGTLYPTDEGYREFGIIEAADDLVATIQSKPGTYTDPEGYTCKYSDFVPVQEPGWYPRTYPTGYITSDGNPQTFISPIGEPSSSTDSKLYKYSYMKISTHKYTVHLTAKGVKGTSSGYTYNVTITYNASSPPPPPVDTNTPPTADIGGPSTVALGDSFTLTGSGSDAEDTMDNLTYLWSAPEAFINSASSSSPSLSYSTLGIKQVSLSVRDTGGLTGTATKMIEVVPPTPVVQMQVTGTLKENRKITLDVSRSYAGSSSHTIDWTKTVWEFKYSDGSAVSYVKTNDSLTGTQVINIISKIPGTVDVTCKITNNAGYEGVGTQKITIQPDMLPIADFSVIKTLLRDSNDLDSYGNPMATLVVTDNSTSVDYDSIIKRIWLYSFDSNNDGNFDNELWYVYNSGNWSAIGNYAAAKSVNIATINSGNLTTVTLRTSKVGKFKFELIVKEEFGQETISDFITDSDRKNANTFDH